MGRAASAAGTSINMTPSLAVSIVPLGAASIIHRQAEQVSSDLKSSAEGIRETILTQQSLTSSVSRAVDTRQLSLYSVLLRCPIIALPKYEGTS